MDISVYLQIQQFVINNIQDFDKGLEAALNKFNTERSETVRSIVAQEYQKFIKNNFRSSHSGENRRKLYREFVAGIQEENFEPGIITNLAIRDKTSPALAARIILEEYLKDIDPEAEPSDRRNIDPALRLRVSELLKNHALIQDRDLAHEILIAKVKDHSYGPIAEAIKHSIGEEHEQKIKDKLQALNIPFSDEHVLRSRGYDKTPDVKLDVPIAVGGKVINWIESKALFGDRESHEGYLRDQFWSYWNRFGSGLVIYWFGYIKQLDSNREAGIVLLDHFPTDVTFYDPSKISKNSLLKQNISDRTSVTDLIQSSDRSRLTGPSALPDQPSLTELVSPAETFSDSLSKLSLTDRN